MLGFNACRLHRWFDCRDRGIEILTLLLWLIAMALLASHSDELDSIDAYVDGLGPAFEAHYKNSIEEYAKGFVVATFAATAVASFNLVLFVVTLVFFGTPPP